jgi:hypothetical protein
MYTCTPSGQGYSNCTATGILDTVHMAFDVTLNNIRADILKSENNSGHDSGAITGEGSSSPSGATAPTAPTAGQNGASKPTSAPTPSGTAAGDKSSEPTPVYIDPTKHPEAAAHAQDAQNSGAPDVLTIDRAGAAGRRAAALKGTSPQTGSDRDEYPPAVTEEGGSGASVRPIDPSDNRGAGGSFGQQIKQLPDGSQIQVIVGPAPPNGQ